MPYRLNSGDRQIQWLSTVRIGGGEAVIGGGYLDGMTDVTAGGEAPGETMGSAGWYLDPSCASASQRFGVCPTTTAARRHADRGPAGVGINNE
jgi:hypothetical protein